MRSLQEYAAMVEKCLPDALMSLGDIPKRLLEPMLYSITSGGKHIRGTLLLSSCEALGGNIDEALPYAAALEMIHCYSLIHDDLPAMDNDDLRRGKPTCHKAFGEDMAILAGDGLLSAAGEILLRESCKCPDSRGARAGYAIFRRAGVTGMAAGQTVDVTSGSEKCSTQLVEYIHLHKTADLLTAPVEAGMILAGADEKTLACGRKYGRNLGITFQIVDDILDVCGDEAVVGKKVRKDRDESKQTWVRAVGIDEARKDAEECTRKAKDACAIFDKDGFFADLAEKMLIRVK